MHTSIELNREDRLEFCGVCIADVAALNHDDTIRRRFRLYDASTHFVAQRIDYPDTIDVRYFGAECSDVQAVYDFFGNEPLANYLYGQADLTVPGFASLLTRQ